MVRLAGSIPGRLRSHQRRWRGLWAVPSHLPPMLLLTTITHIEKATPEWFAAQTWPRDSRNARLKTWSPVPLTIPGAAPMPKVRSVDLCSRGRQSSKG